MRNLHKRYRVTVLVEEVIEREDRLDERIRVSALYNEVQVFWPEIQTLPEAVVAALHSLRVSTKEAVEQALRRSR